MIIHAIKPVYVGVAGDTQQYRSIIHGQTLNISHLTPVSRSALAHDAIKKGSVLLLIIGVSQNVISLNIYINAYDARRRIVNLYFLTESTKGVWP